MSMEITTTIEDMLSSIDAITVSTKPGTSTEMASMLQNGQLVTVSHSQSDPSFRLEVSHFAFGETEDMTKSTSELWTLTQITIANISHMIPEPNLLDGLPTEIGPSLLIIEDPLTLLSDSILVTLNLRSTGKMEEAISDLTLVIACVTQVVITVDTLNGLDAHQIVENKTGMSPKKDGPGEDSISEMVLSS